MRNRVRLSSTALLLLSSAACTPDPAELEARAVEALRTELPALQEAYRTKHGVYAAHIRDLTGGADTLAGGILINVRGGTREGWAASSSHPSVPGAACVAYIGEPGLRVKLVGGVAPNEPGVVSCIAFEPWSKRGVLERSGPYPMKIAHAAP